LHDRQVAGQHASSLPRPGSACQTRSVSDDSLHLRILACIRSIPRGSVLSYGDIAELCGANTPRLVGRVLSLDGRGELATRDGEGGTVPWQRVVRSDGSLATHKSDRQRELLEAEGVGFRGERVDMRRYRWDGLSAPGTPRSAPGRRR
jgi:alkylated DNA nucleotide flippase Atl1